MRLRIPRVVPTRRLALVVALTAPVWLLSGSTAGTIAAAVVSALVVAAVGVDLLRAPRADAVEVTRELPPAVGLGDRVEGAYVLRARWPVALRVRVHNRPPRGVARVSPEPEVKLAAWGEARAPLVLEGRERGVWPLGRVVLRVLGPLGLADRFLRHDADDAITVAPSVAGVRRYRLLALQHRLRDAGVRQLRRRGEGTSFASLREYALGDEPRHIDWKATARRGKPMVREYSVEQGQTVVIAIDAGRLMTQLADGVSRFEHALSAAMVLADVAVHSNDQVGLLLFDAEVRAWVPPARGRPALERLREALIPARATMTEPDYAAAFRTLATRHRKRALLVLFTDAIDVRASQALIAHTARGSARHLPLVVALRNDALVAAARPAPGADAARIYESAAAEELLLAREEALQRMRGAGASVVDVSPRLMAAAVVNRYLELKGRGAV
ncbi:MAG TPA: DUF58 domain-containing protein [Gemmatimonadaceae bacterium]|nr:DUF58 domain-containing protein [Gemmatimonadaceae bacterium]